ncbi:MAG: CPBP family intramembrane metalloprotease, partial [Cyanobacteria bacterium RU_5_0]|nr:CPBP family intramembrane metalloprotease [Cyanobacteria bacterium RU_5_0]
RHCVFAANGSAIFSSPSLLQQQLEAFIQTASIQAFAILNLPFIFLLIGVFLVVQWLHQRPFHTLISADRSIHLRRLMAGFVAWFLLLAIPTAIDYLLFPQNYIFTFDSSQWFVLLPIALILTPLQTSSEEFFFRGYLLQGLGLLTRQPLILILVTNVLFMVLHLANPEVQRGFVWLALYYFSLGAFLTLFTLKDDRLELALGIHAANNLFVVLFFNAKDSALPTPSVWTVNDAGDPRFSLLLLLVQMGVFYFVFFGRHRKPASVS